MFYFRNPAADWLDWENCGIEFVCTGVYNAVVRIQDAQYVGDSVPNLPRTFNAVANNKETVSV